MRNTDRKMWFFLGSGDIILINFAFVLACFLKFDTIELKENYIFLLLVFNFSWILVSSMFSLYTFSRVDHLEHIVSNTIKAGVTHALIITALLFSIKASEQFSRQLILYTYIIDFIVVILWRFIALAFIKRYRVSGYNYRRVVLVGTGSISHQMYKFFQSSQSHGFKLLSVFYYQEAKENYDFSSVDSKDISELEEFCIDNKIDEIYYAMGMNEDNIINNLLSFSDKNMIRLRILPDFSSFLFRKIHVNFYGSLPVITLRDEPLQDEMNRLNESLKVEQKIASESLEARFLYNEFASGVIRQREWLTAAIRVKEEEYESSREKVAHAYGEMRKAEIVRDEAVKNEKQREQTLEQIEIDEIAQNIHRRKIK